MIEWLSRAELDDLRLLNAAVVAALGYALYWLVSRSLRSMGERGHMQPAMESRLRATLRLLALAIIVPIALQEAGAFANAWSVLSAGITAVAIGFFALWSVLSNMVCALLLLIFRPFRVGDEIELIDANSQVGLRGVVKDLDLLFVTLQESRVDDRTATIQVPNNTFFQRSVRRFDREVHGDSFYE
ncbi:MAG: hypothetical protein RJA70_160 [Pseudomonadota bacterium]|jgi:small-conductance mechanosensitive channel